MGRKSTKSGDNTVGSKMLQDEPIQLLKKQVEVYWKDDKAWYKGIVDQVKFDNKDKAGLVKPYHIKYVDGDEEWVNLLNEQWMLLDDGDQKENLQEQQTGEKRKKAATTEDDKQQQQQTQKKNPKVSEAKTSIGTSKKLKKEDQEKNVDNKTSNADIDKDNSINECIEVDPLQKQLLAKTEYVQVEQCKYTPTLYQIVQALPVQDMNDVKVRCGECCVVIDCRDKRNKKDDDNKDTPESQEVVVILPKKINNKSASAFMNRLGQLKIQVLAYTNEQGQEVDMQDELNDEANNVINS